MQLVRRVERIVDYAQLRDGRWQQQRRAVPPIVVRNYLAANRDYSQPIAIYAVNRRAIHHLSMHVQRTVKCWASGDCAS